MVSRRKKKNKGIKSILYIILIGIISFVAIQLYVILPTSSYFLKDIGDLKNIEKPQAVLVLGAGIYPGGLPTPVLRDRLDYAIEIYNYYDGQIAILVSGDNKTVEYNETKVMKDYLISKNIPLEDIYCDYAGFSTYDSIYRSEYIFKVDSIVISTQKFHMHRSLFLANKMGIKAYGYASENKKIYNMPYNHFRESLARIKAVIDGDFLKRPPKYLGDPIPIKRY